MAQKSRLAFEDTQLSSFHSMSCLFFLAAFNDDDSPSLVKLPSDTKKRKLNSYKFASNFFHLPASTSRVVFTENVGKNLGPVTLCWNRSWVLCGWGV